MAFKQGRAKSPWNKELIKNTLLEETHNKCCYCETSVGREASYMEVEHFKPKKLYPDDVLTWDNLMCACSRCNRNKQDHDVVRENIVNPFVDRPNEHIRLTASLNLAGITPRGERSVEVLDLNNLQKMYHPRCEILKALDEKIHGLFRDLNILLTQNIVRVRNTVKDILEQCQPDSKYSAFCATIVTTSSDFKSVVNAMKRCGKFTPDMDDLLQIAQNNALQRD